ncbi:pirin family protein [Microbacterium sp. YY-03]|uniref:pirin family protein n=1 Tax=Microbacterium sp. YY-03 TaxID=3421636 RepID=UPI003D16BA22
MTRLDAEVEPTEPTEKCTGPRVELYEAREVPLGGIRGMNVHRALPQRALPMVGAWCFLDRFGPQHTMMRVEPHPHMGLQTVTWPYAGEIRHRDSVGNDVNITRGALNLMTAGAGISHSEYSITDGPVDLDALQFWIALPESRRWGAADFEQVTDLPQASLVARDSASGAETAVNATVVLGELAGVRSPATVYTHIVGAEIAIPAGHSVEVPLVHDWEHAVLVVEGAATVAADPDTDLAPEQLLYLGIHRTKVVITAEQDTLVFLIGGEPFEADLVMWWNFVGRSHEEIEQAQADWAARTERYGHVIGHGDEWIPAPPMPKVRLTPRRRVYRDLT